MSTGFGRRQATEQRQDKGRKLRRMVGMENQVKVPGCEFLLLFPNSVASLEVSYGM